MFKLANDVSYITWVTLHSLLLNRLEIGGLWGLRIKSFSLKLSAEVFSERELTFTFAICYRPSVCLSSVCLSSVTLVRPTQAVQIFRNISTAFGTLAIHWHPPKILRRSSQGLLASNIGSILDQYVAQYWLHIVRNINPILDSSHFSNIGPILTVNIGPI